jgi:hypothetical protein
VKPTEHTTVDPPMNGDVQPSSLGTQPIGGIARVLRDAYKLKLPVPFPLKFIASYLVEGRRGWTISDPGFDYPAAREAWETGAAEVGLDLDRHVGQIMWSLIPYEVARRVLPEELSDHQLRFALAGTLAHLEHLADEGRAERLDRDVVVSYRAC